MSGRYWDGCRAAPVRLIGWTCAKKAFGLAFAAHIPDERLAALAHVHVLNACAAHAPARRKWPRERRATDKHDELAPLHSITSSARVSMVGAMSRPIAFAALRLITSVNLVGRSIGKSAAFAPLRMRSTYIAARLYMSGRLGP
jgi:hypothetical protein